MTELRNRKRVQEENNKYHFFTLPLPVPFSIN
jgi:hypothetical protein